MATAKTPAKKTVPAKAAPAKAPKETKEEAIARNQKTNDIVAKAARAAGEASLAKAAKLVADEKAKKPKKPEPPKAKITMNLKTGTVKVAAKGKVVETAPKEPEKAKGPQLPMVYRDGTHSAIVFEIGVKHVTLITMGSLKLEEMRRAEFDSAFEPYPEYPVSRCAEIYLASGQYRLIDEPTRERLLVLTGGKCPVPQKTFAQLQSKEDTGMKTSTKVPTHPLRRASDANLREALKAAGVSPAASDKPTAAGKPAATKPTDKPTPAKKTAASKETKPTPAKKTDAKAPAGKPAAKTAPWDKTKGPKPAAKTAPPVRAAKFGEDTKVTMGDTGKAKRGKMLVYIEKAIELAKKGKGATTRGAIDKALADKWEGDDLNTYFPYAVKNGLLVAA